MPGTVGRTAMCAVTPCHASLLARFPVYRTVLLCALK
jgi:hypothetical protein